MIKRSYVALCVAALLASAATGVAHARVDTEALEARVTRLESQGLVDLLTRIEQLRNEVQQLRGQVEEQNYRLETLEQRQREINTDLDNRLRALEPASAPTLDPAAGVTPELPADTPAPTGDAPAPATPPGAATPPAPVAPAAPAGDEQAVYQAAFDLLKKGQYEKASAGFRGYLASFPSGRLADNAQYWLGETSYVMRNYSAALDEFSQVLERYPHSAKLPDAQLKIGYIHYEKGDWKQAREALNQVKARYPDSTAARLADERLKRMQREGR